MSVATFYKDLKVFSSDDNYVSPVSVSLSSGNQSHGRITWSGDGKWLAVAPLDRGIGPLPIFKYANKNLQPLKYVTLSNISSASFFNWTNRNIAIGNEAGEVFVWDIKDKKIAVKVEYVETQPVDFIVVNSDDSYLASASLTSNKICLHGLKTNKVVNTISIPKSNHTSSLKCCMSKKNFLGASSIESTICVWDIHRSEFVFKTLNSHSGACTDISFSPINFQVIASVSLTKTLKMYDLREGKLVLDANVGEPMNCVDIILNGDKVALGTTGGSIIIYDLRADKVFHTFNAHQGPVLSVKTQNLKIPKTYQEVEMNTPDQVENPSKTLDISVMDIFSPININSGKNISNGPLNQSKSVSFQSTPKLVVTNSESICTYEDSFLRKVLSPLPQNMVPTSQSSPYICPVVEQSPINSEQNTMLIEKDLSQKLKESKDNEKSTPGNANGAGDGFHVDDVSQRNLYYSDIVSEIRNSQKEVLNEIRLIRKEVSDIKTEFDNKFKLLQENYESLYDLLRGEIKQEVYAGNCDSKIEHISQRILLNELSKLILSNGEKINEEIKLNAFRLKHIYDLLKATKEGCR